MLIKACTSAASAAAIGAVVLLLAGCASEPTYTTRYTLDAPKTDQGRACVVDCQRNQNLCEGNVRAALQDCEANARQGRDDCAKAVQDDYQHCLGQMQPQWSAATRNNVRGNCVSARNNQANNCNLRYSSSSCGRSRDCDASYRQCFQVCGGKVRAERVCVSNCDQAARR